MQSNQLVITELMHFVLALAKLMFVVILFAHLHYCKWFKIFDEKALVKLTTESPIPNELQVLRGH